MTDSQRVPKRRARRSTTISRRLEDARRRNAEQLAEQRRQEEAVEAALAEFFDADDQRAAAEQDCARRIEPHRRAIARVEEDRDRRVAEQDGRQAAAALLIHEAERTVAQVGAVLGIGEKAARRLIAAGRARRDGMESTHGGRAGSAEPSGPVSPAGVSAGSSSSPAEDDAGASGA